MKITEVLAAENMQDDAYIYIAQNALQEDGSYKEVFRRVPLSAFLDNLLSKKNFTSEQQKQARANIGAWSNGESTLTISGESPDTAVCMCTGSITSEDGKYPEAAVMRFDSPETSSEKAILRNVYPGVLPYDAVNKAQLDKAIDDIETALDSIIAIQENLIGVISFTFGGGMSCTALKGMTWSEWCRSSYNEIGIVVGDDGVVYDSAGDPVALGDVVQYGTTVLVDGAAYLSL